VGLGTDVGVCVSLAGEAVAGRAVCVEATTVHVVVKVGGVVVSDTSGVAVLVIVEVG
jgi:hypothetical protein